MPSRRYTLRLPPALDATVQAHLQATGVPFADLMREALTAYLAAPTPTPTRPGPASLADSTADTLTRLVAHVEALTRRLEHLEQERTPPTPPTAATQRSQADSQPTPPEREVAYRRMVALQAEGFTLAQIAAQLTREGHRTRQGRAWHKSTVSYVLRTHGR
jgi:hypothetical protein